MRSDEEAPEYGDALGREWHEPADHLICEGRFRGEADIRGHVASVGSAAVDNPQPTKAPSKSRSAVGLPQCYLPLRSTGEIAGETARVHHAARRRGSLAARGACAAAGYARDRVLRPVAGLRDDATGGAAPEPERSRLRRRRKHRDLIPMGRVRVWSAAGA